MGINVFNKASISNLLHLNQFLNIPDLMMEISEKGGCVKCYQEECEWLDIGRVDDYKAAVEVFENHPERFLPDILCEH